MNHYERLKVTQDAPPEVVRAAYRALAQALPHDEHREVRLTELNAAYETLINPESRQAYDAVRSLEVPDAAPEAISPGEGASSSTDAGVDIALDALAVARSDASSSETANDEDLGDPWQSVYDAPTFDRPQPWPRQPMVWAAGMLVLLMTAGLGVWMWQLYKANQFAQGMAVQVEQGASAVLLPPEPMPALPVTESPRKLSLEELSRLSDEELLAVLPTLGASAPYSERSVRELPSAVGPGALRSGVSSRHPLDGAPLNLRTEGELVDPLAPEVSTRSAVRGR